MVTRPTAQFTTPPPGRWNPDSGAAKRRRV